MKTILPILLAIAPALPAQAELLEQVFARYDTNRDKKVVRTEFPGSDEQFAAMDANRDGNVTFAEFEASPTAKRLLLSRRNDAAAPRPRLDPAELVTRRLDVVDRFDANKDGRVTRAEWTGSEQAFDELDLDRNGRIDASDRTIARRNRPATADPIMPEWKSRLEEPDDLMKRLDQNKDQLLTIAEVRGHRIAPAFAFADRNDDGSLDIDELRRLVGAANAMVYARELGSGRARAFEVPFDAWDKNDDDRIELDEWTGDRYLFGRIDLDRDAAVTRDEVARYKRGIEGSGFLERFDLDGDGKVTLKEFGGSESAFRRIDRNGDSVVSRADR
jgi:Ca2+-binding EF-hand superfamily protein